MKIEESLLQDAATRGIRFEALLERDELDLRELVRENMVFHEAILDGAASARLAAMVRKVIDLPLVYRSYIWYSPEQQRISGHYHVQITRALEARDAERAGHPAHFHPLHRADVPAVEPVGDAEDRGEPSDAPSRGAVELAELAVLLLVGLAAPVVARHVRQDKLLVR